MKARKKFLVGSGIIVATLLALAYVGYTQSKTYYHTISELPTLHGSTLHQRMRVSGNVRAGSISHRDGRVNFVLEEQGKDLTVSYIGRDPLPDTFKDGAQALVEGRLMPDGGFVAEQVQAKCASKYEAVPRRRAQHRAATRHIRQEQELIRRGNPFGYFRFVCTASRVSGHRVRVRRRNRRESSRAARCSRRARDNAGMAVFGLVTLAVACARIFLLHRQFFAGLRRGA